MKVDIRKANREYTCLQGCGTVVGKGEQYAYVLGKSPNAGYCLPCWEKFGPELESTAPKRGRKPKAVVTEAVVTEAEAVVTEAVVTDAEAVVTDEEFAVA